jgi:hypothetical protein
MSLINQMFLFINCSLWAIFTTCFANFVGCQNNWNGPHAAHMSPLWHCICLAMDSTSNCIKCWDEATSSQASDIRLQRASLFLGRRTGQVLFTSPHATYSRWDSYQVITVESQWIQYSPAVIHILEPHKNHSFLYILQITWLSDFLAHYDPQTPTILTCLV